MPRLSLVISAWEGRPETWSDLERIARGVTALDPGIDARVVPHRRAAEMRLLPLWFRPTLSVSMIETKHRKLLPGRFVNGRRLGKIGEYRRLDAAGIPIPKWTAIGPETRLDPAEWGEYVVEKPSEGRLGAHVRIRRAGRVRYVPPEALPPEHYGRRGPMLAQRFVYTGPWPTSWRVVTLFGEALLCYRQVTAGRGDPLAGPGEFGTGGFTIVSNTKDMSIELDAEPAVLAFCEHAHRAAFADVPLLNFDVVRDARDGTLWVLECHPGGGWLFSSDMGLQVQAASGVRFEEQFGAVDKAARILADRTRRWARRAPPFGTA